MWIEWERDATPSTITGIMVNSAGISTRPNWQPAFFSWAAFLYEKCIAYVDKRCWRERWALHLQQYIPFWNVTLFKQIRLYQVALMGSKRLTMKSSQEARRSTKRHCSEQNTGTQNNKRESSSHKGENSNITSMQFLSTHNLETV